jgi:Alternative complex III, ActD subunit
MAQAASGSNTLYGLMAEFDDVNALTEAAKRTYAEGYRKMDAYSPFPIEPVWEAMHIHDRPVSFFVLCGGIVGMISGFGLCYWVSTMAYPLNVGGRPLNSWPAFIPVTFELTILIASFCALISMLALNGLPMPYHPVFNVPSFIRASQDRFFLAIEAVDPKFDRTKTFEFLKSLGPREVNEVEN